MEREYIKIKKPSPLPDYTTHLKELDDDKWKDWVFYHLLKFYQLYDEIELHHKIDSERKKPFPKVERAIARYIRLWLKNDREFDTHFRVIGEETNDEEVEGNYDITITHPYWSSKDFYFECKNLDGDKDLTGKYVNYNTYKKNILGQNIFDGGVFKGVTNIPAENIYVENSFRFTQRTFQLTYSQSFGNKKLNDKRNRFSGSDEEQKRMK